MLVCFTTASTIAMTVCERRGAARVRPSLLASSLQSRGIALCLRRGPPVPRTVLPNPIPLLHLMRRALHKARHAR